MEQQDEEKREVCTRRTIQTLPLDLASIILSKLRARSVVRFRSVSKLWSSLTSDPAYFNTRPRLLVMFREGDKLFFFSLPQHNQNPNTNEAVSYYYSQPIDFYNIKTYPKDSTFTIKTELVHGLMILIIFSLDSAFYLDSADIMVWNPSMKRFVSIPCPGWGWKGLTFLLGYDPIECKHKLVCMPCDNASDVCRVLTLGSSRELWRRIKTNHKHCPLTNSTLEGNFTGDLSGRCINGDLYYHAKRGYDRVLMRFDVRSEKFHVITLPYDSFWRVMMTCYEGKLACVGYSKRGKRISMWVLEDAKRRQWSYHIYPSLSHYVPELQNQFKLIGLTDDGELIYAPETLLNTLDVIYMEPKRQTFRIVTYRGIADDEFRQRNRLGDRLLCGLHLFPNHIETIIS